MASYSYASLLVPVHADTKPLVSEVSSGAVKAGQQAGRSISRGISSHLGGAAKGIGRGVATALGTATIAATAFGVESFKAAAKVDTMNASLQALAKANHASWPQMQKTVQAMRKQGIEAGAAQSLVASFTKTHISLAKATDLATVAQNAAAVTGKSSSETLIALNKGIQTQNVRLLRTAGVGVDVKKAMADYAATLGTTTDKLTSQQRAQAVLNGVLKNGQKNAGAYAAAMRTPGKVLSELPRIVDEIKIAVGEGLVKALGPAIVGAGHLAVAVQEAIEPGGKLAPIFDQIARSATTMLSPLTKVVDLTARWLENMKPGQVQAMASAVGKYAPQLASVATGLAAFAGKNLLGDLPVVGRLLGGLGGPLGIVITSLATLALTSPQARDALMGLAGVLMKALAPVMAGLVPIIGELGQALAQVLAAGLRAVIPLVPVLVVALGAALKIITPLLPVITFLSRVLAAMAPVLVPLVAIWWAYTAAMGAYEAAIASATIATWASNAANLVATVRSAAQTAAIVALYAVQYTVRAATIAWTAAQWLLNAALSANPIGLVVIACAALGAALVLLWQRSDTFRKIVSAAWAALNSVIGTITGAITRNISTAVRIWLAVVTLGTSELVRVVVKNWGLISSTVARTWSNLINGARIAGAAVVNGLKSGITGAIAGIGGWVKKSIVDPIVNAVKHFFGIHSPSTVMEGIGGFLIKGLFLGMTPGISGIGNMIGSVFGGWPHALAAMVSKGLIGIAGLPGKALSAIMSLFGGGGNAAQLAPSAAKYAGHRYVWGGPANPSQGFDCSSFVNLIAGSLGLPLPGGFRAPSGQHGPSTTSWLPFGTMKRPGFAQMAMNDLYVNDHHMGIVTGKGTGFAARSTATGTGPQSVGGGYTILRFPGGGVKLPGWLEGIRGKVTGLFSKVGGFFSGLFGGGPSGGQGNPGGGAGVARWRGLAMQVLQMFGRPDLIGPLMAQMQTESGGNERAQNNWDSNARIGQNSRGLMQVIPSTFAAYAGPFIGKGIFDPFANIYAAVAYALSRYGSRLAAVWGAGHGYAKGGLISEPILGIGQRTGTRYSLGERGPEWVSPLTGPAAQIPGGGGRGPTIHVHPSAGMDERALAAMVNRELAWAAAGGGP